MRKSVQDFFLFLLGGALFAAGLFLFTNQVMIGSGFQGWGRHYGRGFGLFFGPTDFLGNGQGFGLLAIPFGLGVALLMADAYRRLAWFLVWASAAAVGAAVLQSLFFSFRPTSLWNLAAMVVMIAGGAGLMFKSLRDYPDADRPRCSSESKNSEETIRQLRDELDQLKRKIDKD